MTDEMRANIAMLKARDAKLEAQALEAVDKAFSTKNSFICRPPLASISKRR